MMFWKRLEHLLPWRRAAEDARGEWGWTRLEQTGQDLRYAIRTLSKSPGFTLAAVLSLAIGIGANTALFTVINTVMWKRLPVSDPEHLLTIGQQSQAGTTSGFTYQQYELFRDHGQALDLAACSLARLDASIDGQAEPTLDAQLVTGEYFRCWASGRRWGACSTRRRPRPDGTSGRRAQPHLLAAPLRR